MKNNKKRWLIAQNAEYKHYKVRRFKWESYENWRGILKKEFHMDFDDFKNKTILEVGCGKFGLIYFIPDSKIKVGIEPLIHIYSEDIDFNKSSNIDLIRGIGEYIPFKDSSFDFIIIFNVLDHTMDPKKVMREVKRVCKNDGRVIFMMNTFEIPLILRKILNFFDKPHPHHFNKKEILNMLSELGFSIEFIKFYKLNLNFSNITLIKMVKLLISVVLRRHKLFILLKNTKEVLK
ncbi:MAG: class I SAM-dependent methyltransferase [Archaeoglobaceae archaeon]